MDLSKFICTSIFMSCYMDLLKLLRGFVRVVLRISRPLPNKTTLKFDQDFKACWSFCFELKVLNEAKYSVPWVHCAFDNVLFLFVFLFVRGLIFSNEGVHLFHCTCPCYISFYLGTEIINTEGQCSITEIICISNLLISWWFCKKKKIPLIFYTAQRNERLSPPTFSI